MGNVRVSGVSAVVAALLLSGGCAAQRVGHASGAELQAAGVESVIVSEQSAGALARCFESQARLLPMSSLRYEPDLQQTTYRLAGYGLWLEEASFRDLPAGGAEVRFRHAGNYDARWLENVERDRLEPLRRCAAGAA
jgi:hypothetical protein